MDRMSLCDLFFFNDTATTEIYTLSLHDALPILVRLGDQADVLTRVVEGDLARHGQVRDGPMLERPPQHPPDTGEDRKSTRLNSSHGYISYAVFCLKKKNSLHDRFCSTQRHCTPI